MATNITTMKLAEQAVKVPGKECIVLEQILDFSATNVVASDIVHALSIPAGMVVTKVITICKTAEGATATANVGDGAGSDSWDAAVDINSAGSLYSSQEGTDAYAGGKLYSSADTIDVIPSANLDTAVLVVMAIGYMTENGI